MIENKKVQLKESEKQQVMEAAMRAGQILLSKGSENVLKWFPI